MDEDSHKEGHGNASLGNLLARLDERTKAIQNNIIDIRKDVKTYSDVLSVKIDDHQDKIEELRKSDIDIDKRLRTDIEEKLSSIKKDLESNFVKKESYIPVQRIVYGLVGLVLTIVFTALFGLVVTK